MATVFDFSIHSEGLFPNQKVDVPSFTEEIQASAITAALVSVQIVENGEICRVTFATDLTPEEEIILSGLVQAHTAIPSGEPHTLPYIWQVKNPPANQAEVKMNVMGLANIIDEYKMMRAATICGVQIRLKNALTAGTMTITIAKNGAATSKTKVVDPAKGKTTLWLLTPDKLTFEKGDSLGIRYSTSADMLPASDNEIDINCEVSWMT